MSAEKNELLDYIENALREAYRKVAVMRKNDVDCIEVYEHLESGKRLVKRTQKNRNDAVYRLLKGFRSNHLPTIYEVCSTQAGLCVLEEYIEGKTLAERLKEGAPNRHTACRLIAQICDALTFLHARGIIHRDIKPDNIMIRPDGSAVLIDLSIARCAGEDEECDTQNLGTVGFAAPEQFGLSQSGVATDIYALGVLLNILISGVHPIMDLPRGPLKRIVKKATATQISRRYQSAQKMKRSLWIYCKKIPAVR